MPINSEDAAREQNTHIGESANENTPLLGRHRDEDDSLDQDVSQNNGDASGSSTPTPVVDKPSRKARRWPSVIALILLSLFILAILIVGFFAPETIESYAKQAMVFEPTRLSIDSFSQSGVQARIQGNFQLDASRVEQDGVRRLGIWSTWLAREITTNPADVQVSLPEFDDVVVGTAHLPMVRLSLVDGQVTRVNLTVDLAPGPVDGIRRIANDWIDGRLGQVRLIAHANLGLKLGFIPLGVHTIAQSLVFEGTDLPSMPPHEIQSLVVAELVRPDGSKILQANASVVVENKWPVQFEIPPLAFSLLVDGCSSKDPFIRVADSATSDTIVLPKRPILVNTTGIVSELPEEFITACPHSTQSPMDLLLEAYLNGKNTKLYVSGSKHPIDNTPSWIADVLSSVTVPIDLSGQPMGDLIKNFSFADMKFGLPDFFADPDSPDSKPTITTNIVALIGLPREVNFAVDVHRVRANATILYKGEELGVLDLRRWQNATSKRVPNHGLDTSDVLVRSHIEKAPVSITNDKVFQDVVQALLLGEKGLEMAVRAVVDVDLETVIGGFVVKDIPVQGVVPIHVPSRRRLQGSMPTLQDFRIRRTTQSLVEVEARMNFTNPTPYSARIPFADIHLVCNDTVLGHGYVEDLHIRPGVNSDIVAVAVWEPAAVNSTHGGIVGAELLSQFISGSNATLSLQTHSQSFPAQQHLGDVLAAFPFEISLSELLQPGKPPDGHDGQEHRPQFIKDTIMHIFSSSATFVLFSPFLHDHMFISNLNATALYEDEPAGTLWYEEEIEVSPGDNETPKLPVDWSLGSIGFKAISDALGGSLRVDAQATTQVRIGEYVERVWFKGHGIGAKIRL